MIGALAGDIIGSRYEAFPTKEYEFYLFHEDCRFTDDTVLTVAIADWILHGGDSASEDTRSACHVPSQHVKFTWSASSR